MRRTLTLLFALFLLAGCGDDDDPRGMDGSTPGRDAMVPPGTDAGPGGTGDACIPGVEICGDRMDQNCDGRDQSCGNNDGDVHEACRAGDDLTMCDCDDSDPLTYPGAPETCDGRDNDCDGRVDEVADCCAGCAGIESSRADMCLADGSCDCSTSDGVGPCPDGQSCCANGCTNTTTDFMNCGLCGRACNDQSDTCAGGTCLCGSNPPCDFVTMCRGGSCG